jgi:hypothetical protein
MATLFEDNTGGVYADVNGVRLRGNAALAATIPGLKSDNAGGVYLDRAGVRLTGNAAIAAGVPGLFSDNAGKLYSGSAGSRLTGASAIAAKHAAATLRSVGVRALSATALNQFENWLSASAGHIMLFCDDSSWANSLAKMEGEIEKWAHTDVRREWVFPLCNSTQNLAATNAGTHDAAITEMFEVIAAEDDNDEIWVRLGWEMNLATSSGYPWSAVDNGSANYVSAYKRVHALARAVDSRFVFTWAPNWAANNPEPMYPGDEYVDVIGMDAYFKTQFEQSSGQTGDQVWAYKLTGGGYGLNWLASFALLHGKPIALCEWGGNADVPEYMTGQANWLLANNVKYHGYWDQTTPTAANCKLSNMQYPNIGAIYRAAFGDPTVTRAWNPMLYFGTDLVGWYDASDEEAFIIATGVERWYSEHGAGKSGYQGNTALQPVRSATARNGLPGVTFDGSDDFLNQSDVTDTPTGQQAFGLAVQAHGDPTLVDFTYFLSIADATNAMSLGVSNAGYARWQQGGNFLQSPSMAGVDRSIVLSAPAGATVNMTGGLDGDLTPKTASIARTAIATPTRLVMGAAGIGGSAVGSYAKVTMQEVIIVKRELTAAETDKLHGYLAHKWKGTRGSIALEAGHPYEDNPPAL